MHDYHTEELKEIRSDIRCSLCGEMAFRSVWVWNKRAQYEGKPMNICESQQCLAESDRLAFLHSRRNRPDNP